MSAQTWFDFDTAEMHEISAHEGVGLIQAARVVERPAGALAFVDMVVLPPQTTIGRHTHGDDEEIYVVVSGHGHMVVDGDHRDVAPGDVVLNRPRGTHELRNDGPDDVRLVVVDVRAPSKS